MCNLYYITTNQPAVAALFRVVDRYIGHLALMTGLFGSGDPQHGRRTQKDNAVGHAAAR